MMHQDSASDPGEISDVEIPQTPTLTGSKSTLSLGDSPLQSPSSIVFPNASRSSPARPLADSSSRTTLKGSCKAWWGRRTSADSSNSTSPLDLRPCEPLFSQPPSHSTDESTEGRRLRPDRTVSTPTAPPNYHDDISKSKKTIPFDAGTEELNAGFQTVIGPSYLAMPDPRQIGHSTSREELSQPLTPPRLDPGLSLAQPSLSDSVNVAPSSTEAGVAGEICSSSLPVPLLSVPQEDQAPDLDESRVETSISSLLDLTHDDSSMLAHCDQNSLAPPCESLTQTQCGRTTLRQAGIAHGSARALAPSLPVENVPARLHNCGFLQRLVRKTFTKSPSTTSSSSSRPSALSLDLPSRGNWELPRSRTVRHSMAPVFAQTEPALESQAPPVKRSRWAIIQRFVAKPSNAAKAAQVKISRRTHSRFSSSIDSTARSGRTQPLTSGRSSSLSFFGDPRALVDPFARTGGLGATVSVSSSPEPFNHSRPYLGEGGQAHIVNRYAHIIRLSTEDGWQQSRDEGIEGTGPFDSRMPPPYTLFYGSGASQAHADNPTPPVHGEVNGRNPNYRGGLPSTNPVSRRHSAPLLNRISLPSAAALHHEA